ncbi:MAG: TonB family protein [Cyanobacteria bacterium P01_A01_bin.84]
MILSGIALEKRLSEAKYLRIFLTCSVIGSLLFHFAVLASGVVNLLVKVPEAEEEPVEIVLLDEPIEEVKPPEPIKPKPEVEKIETPPKPKLEIPDIPKPATPFQNEFTLPEVDEPLQQKPLEPEPVKPIEPQTQPKTTQLTPPEPIQEPEPVKPIEPQTQPKTTQLTPPEPIQEPEPIQPKIDTPPIQPSQPIQSEQKDWGSLLSKKSDTSTPKDFSIDKPISPVPNPSPIPNNNSNTRRRKRIGSSNNNNIASNSNLGNIGSNSSRGRKKIGGSNSIASNPISPNPGIGNDTGDLNGSGDGRAACRRCTKRYPSWARSQRIEGTIVVMVNANAEGTVTNVELVSGSGNNRLDNYHIKQVRRWKLKSSSNGINNVRIVTKYQLKS